MGVCTSIPLLVGFWVVLFFFFVSGILNLGTVDSVGCVIF